MKGTTKFLDAWIPETRVLIEHKSRGVNLDAPQAGHNGLTPYEQAAEYDAARSFDEKARWIVTCNFDEFRIYDRAKPLAPPLTLKLANLPKEAYRLNFLVNPKEKAIDRELEISVQAGRIVGELYDAFLKQYGNSDAKTLAALNRLCVRLVFCLYAEDAEIFPKDCFRRLVEASDARRLRSDLQRLFITLDTPLEKRDAYLENEFRIFPYTNGGLFRDAAETDIPPLTEDIRKLLIGATQFDWREITPTIFGALFESTLNPVTRRAGGMVYTSVENIHKVIDPLFLAELTRRVNKITALPPSSSTQKELKELQTEIASLAFLDPASGSGNFLTETFICLRRLENRIIAALQQGQREFDLGTTVKVSISQFRGIEINDFAVSVAKTALWIAEAQMLKETAEILHREPDYLPLKEYDGIVEGNALRMDWNLGMSNERWVMSNEKEQKLISSISSPISFNYIMGNPPFVGARNKSSEQAADMEEVFGKNWKGLGNLDYVTCWYKKAADYILGITEYTETKSSSSVIKNTKCAFVSTNSICQGEAVALLWKPLFEKGVEIDFAWRTFRWDNEAQAKAHVHCVIIGFGVRGDNLTQSSQSPQSGGIETSRTSRTSRELKIFDGDKVIEAANINGYLMDAPNAWIESRTKPICNVPVMGIGNKPIDGGNYLFLEDEMNEFIKKEPESAKYFRPWYGSEEFINGKKRYCLWLGDCSPTELFSLPECMKRVQAVRDFRLASKSDGTRKIADKPTRFHVENMPKGNYLLVPSVSSERREYVPMGFMDSNTIASNLVLIVPSATLYHFGVLTSSVHMAWMRTVCGRLKSDYRYSANIVYNNFPWPDIGERGDSEKTLDLQNSKTPSNDSNIKPSRTSRELITQTAQSILDARAKYPNATLAQMYGDKMYLFPELVAAHAANDRAVLAAYGLAPDTPEPEIVAYLFKLYANRVNTSQV